MFGPDGRRDTTWRTSSSSGAPGSTTSRTSRSTCPATPSSCSPGCPGPASRQPGLRHDLRRGPAPLRRVAVGVRPPVPRARWTSPTSTSSRACRPAVSIDQKSTSKNPRSTVGTITEVYDYLRLLYARAGRPHCPTCGAPIERQTPQQIVDRVLTARGGHPVPGAGAGDPRPQGRVRRAVPRSCRPRASPGPGSTARPTRSTSRPSSTSRRSTPSRSSSTGSRSRRPPSAGSPTRSRPRSTSPAGWCVFDFVDLDAKDPGRELRFSEKMACPNDHPIDTDELEPRSFSFNSPVRRLPGVPRPRHPDGGRPRAGRPRPAGDPRARARSSRGAGAHVADYFLRLMGALGDELGFDLNTPVGGPPGQGRRSRSSTGHPTKVHVVTRNRYGRERVLLRRVRGRPPLHRAPPPRGRVRHQPGALRGLHARGAVPGLRRAAASSRCRWR